MTDLSDAHTACPSLKGRRALITGGTTGIGRAIAVLLASEGVDVFICGRTPEHLADALARIGEVGTGDGISLDLADPDGVDRVFKAAQGYFGAPDIVIANAAVPAGALAESEASHLRYRIAVDFTAYLLTAHKAVGVMEGGSDLVFIGSMSAVSRNPGGSIYVAAKAGIEAFAQVLRKEVAGRDIKVGLVEPGFTGADFHYPELPADEQAALIAENRMLRGQDIAVAVRTMLTQPRRAALSLIRVEPLLERE
ncbi:NAD(P)-dependent oxidoreductase [Sphingobium amiense]|uniref:NAD(P)-dependent oxidoreductase n=1 Tax=Sphingobium amiense TaxID=135719 RepID=A0A494WD00_9SPHN|nr:SDR family oxidoreductase [Sphingobium amiense]BBD98209.1 NAD(P)-dependent oxidoreductase [Sphingobium amiense]